MKKRNRFRFFGISALRFLLPTLFIGLAASVYAQDQLGLGYAAGTGLTSTDIRVTIAKIIRTALGLLGIIAVLIVLYAGFLWMTAGGEEDKVSTAKKTLSAGVIGLVIIMSAFAIASFVLNGLVEATGISSNKPDERTDRPPCVGLGCDITGGPTGFRPTGIQPMGTIGKYDVQTAITLSASPATDSANIKAAITLEKLNNDGTRTTVAYTPSLDRNTIRLIPTKNCPPPDDARFCLEPDTEYAVTVKSGVLKNVAGSATANCAFGAVCNGRFTTGSKVGTKLPTIKITSPKDGESVAAGGYQQIQALVTDEYGVSEINYLADGSFFDADGTPDQIADGAWTSEMSWNADFAAGSTVALTAEVANIDGDKALSAPVNVVIVAPHCTNGIKDADEPGPEVDCGGSDCRACAGASCTEDSDCASAECVSGQCVDTPKITDVQLRDGAPGNLVTIFGERLGSSGGKVVFLGGESDPDVEAALGECSDAWSNSRIVVKVPVGAASGPIQVVTAANKTDFTNDLDNGPIIADFVVNGVVRPGICSVAPLAAAADDAMTVSGTGFGNIPDPARVTFARAGSDCTLVSPYQAYVADPVEASLWTSEAIRPKVPRNIAVDPEGTNYLLTVTVSNQTSNPQCVRALPPETGTLPRIEFLSPEGGSVGTYLTISGSNFGSAGTVKFRTPGGQIAYGETTFPAQCATGIWKSDTVIVKVPGNFTVPANTPTSTGRYDVSVVRGSDESNVKPFTINTEPLGPSICRIDPDNGPANSGVSIFGERFGEIGTADLAILRNTHPNAATFHDGQNVTSIGAWHENSITAVAPAGAKSGPVVVRTFPGTQTLVSNPANFRVLDCRQSQGDTACSAGNTCCPDGSCRAEGSCGVTSVKGGYSWTFSTGPIPRYPIVLEDSTCDLGTTVKTPSPNPYRGATGVCTDMSAITVRFNLPMDVAAVTNPTNVTFESCGTGASISSTCSPAYKGLQNLYNYGSGIKNLFSFRTTDGAGVSKLAPGTWYKLTLKSGTGGFRSTADIASDRESQMLDGNFDGQPGGDYVTTFKTGSDKCLIAAVDVQPDNGLIDGADKELEYIARPLSNSCVELACPAAGATWVSSNVSKATIASDGTGLCTAKASPIAETVPGPDINITGTAAGKSDAGKLKVDYVNPAVVSYGPADCDEACVDGTPFARFNTRMVTSGEGNVLTAARIRKCFDESCRSFTGGDILISSSYVDDTNRLLLDPVVNLESETFYRVIISGIAESTSQAKLTNLNYAYGATAQNSFSWTFRTRPSGNPCGPQKISVEPAETVLHYIEEVASVAALPLTEPDSCSAEGQILSAASYDWQWSDPQDPASPDAITLRPYHPEDDHELLNTSTKLAPGCSSICLKTGSNPPDVSECGNNSIETGEECDPSGTVCSPRCLLLGNSLAGATGTGKCGNGTVENSAGEACDEGAENGKDDSGCTSECLFTGAILGVSVCGNGSIGPGEACDDGNKTSGDGCNASCLKEGTESGISVCGDGALEDGEQCDYVTGSDGKATELKLPMGGGTVLGVPLGASDVKDANNPAFACTNRCLLKGNRSTCADDGDVGCCGNGVIDYLKGEGCDAAAGNGLSGSGCSEICTKTGSSPAMRAFCGDGDITVKTSTDTVANGGGEECEAIGTDANKDSVQYVTALARCEETGAENNCKAFTDASVSFGGRTVTGSGKVSVSCSCRTDSDCTAFQTGTSPGLACGAGACCYQRPQAPEIMPNGGNECRNALITVTFPVAMDEATLKDNLLVFEKAGTCTMPADLAVAGQSGPWYARAWKATTGFLKSFVGGKVPAQAAECELVKGKISTSTVVEQGGDASSISTFIPEAAYAESTVYEVVVRGGENGAKSANGTGYSGIKAASQTFTTGTDICSFDVLQVEDSSVLLQASNQTVALRASPMSSRNGVLKEIAPIDGLYDWSLTWSLDDAGTELLSLGRVRSDKTLDTSPIPDGSQDAGIQAPKGKNGQAQVIATSVITTNALFQDSATGTTLVGSSQVTIFVCDNPWPARDTNTGIWEPYKDEATHLAFYYCRDSSTGELLPNLNQDATQGKSPATSGLQRFCKTWKVAGTPQPAACITDAQCGNRTGDCESKDLLFRFSDPKLKDAIGLRVYANPERYSPLEWFKAQNFSGSPESLAVDGYDAVKDAQTLYVSAADKYGDPEIRPYIYVIGFNDRATGATAAIFDQLVKNAKFNTNMNGTSSRPLNLCKNNNATPDGALASLASKPGVYVSCSSDLDCHKAFGDEATANLYCDSDKDKLRRDMKRWGGLFKMVDGLEAAREATGSYPKLESGSYIRGRSVSTWPSWSQIGAAGAVKDPLNAFNQCDKFGSFCSVTRVPCSSDAHCDSSVKDDVCRPKFEAETCFDNKAGLYMCPAFSHVYGYQAIGGVDYRLFADFEFDRYPWQGSTAQEKGTACNALATEFTCSRRKGCVWDSGISSCKSRIIIDNPSCVGEANVAMKCRASGVSCAKDSDCPNDVCVRSAESVCVKSKATCSKDSDCGTGDACGPKDALFLGGATGTASCGNGIVEGNEACEIGQVKTDTAGCTVGLRKLLCKTDCSDWNVLQACPAANPAHCGNGSIESWFSESCDDGPLTGSYGRCRAGTYGCQRYCIRATTRDAFIGTTNLTTTPPGDIGGPCTTNANCGTGFVCTDRHSMCGDGVKNGSEACDNGTQNGQYDKCAWDCRGSGPRCGDMVVNGTAEECDGGTTVSKGICMAEDIADTVSNTVGVTVGCSQANDPVCPTGTSCRLCSASTTGLPQNRTRSCMPRGNTSTQCKYTTWSSCKPSGSCGNGVKEGAEECDAGSANSTTGACLPTCKANVCNDGAVHSGVEQCDNGNQNGVMCTPSFGTTCNYCKKDCTVETISGSYCGDGIKTTPPETCEPGRVSRWCSKTLNAPGGAKACSTNEDCLPKGQCGLPWSGAPIPPGATRCNSSRDCDANFSCVGGQGECISYGSACTADPYTNMKASSPIDGSCQTCSTSCSLGVTKSPKYCGDGFVQPEFGEQCEGVGDATGASVQNGSFYECVACRGVGQCGNGKVENKTGVYSEVCDTNGDPKATGATQYECKSDCKAWQGGFCGDNAIQASHGEVCDGTSVPDCKDIKYANGVAWGTGASRTVCKNSCQPYGASCDNGPLSPGDMRFIIEWTGGKDIDTHVILPSSATIFPNVGSYGAPGGTGTVLRDPHVWIAWDDRGAGSDNPPNDPNREILTLNWRTSTGNHWPSTRPANLADSSPPYDPYKVYLTRWSSGDIGPVTVYTCFYDANVPFSHANCDNQYKKVNVDIKANYWHFMDIYTNNQGPFDTPYFSFDDRKGSCACGEGHACSRGQCPSVGL